jgi:protein-S-isoprenylcysteine O-methyltransferase Ste14
VPGITGPGAWIGALLFGVSIAVFLFSYAVTFAAQPVAARPLRDTAFNVLLFAIFASHHSLFARTRIRTWMARTVPALSERTLFVCVASVLFLVVCLYWRLLPGIVWHAAGPAAVILHAVQFAGIALIVKSAAVVGIRDLAGLSAQGDAEVKVRGPYRWIRHPIYAGWLLLTFAVPLMSMTRFVFAVASAAYLLAAIPLEERTLRRAIPEGYPRYAAAVKWRLLPGVYGWLLVVVFLG